MEAHLFVEVVPVRRIGLHQDLGKLGHRRNHLLDLLLCDLTLPVDRPHASFGLHAFGPGFGHPLADLLRVTARVQGRPVTSHPLIAVVDRLAGGFDGDAIHLVCLGVHESPDRLLQSGWVKDPAEPRIQLREDVVLADVDGTWMLDLVRQGVLDGKLAPVVGAAVVPGAFHAPLAHAAVEQVAEDVGARGPSGFALLRRPPVGRQQRLCLLERLGVDERLVDDRLRPDPLLFGVPLQFGHVPLGDVVDVQELLLLVLLVPDLATRVARVEEDRSNRRLGPGDPRAVSIAGPVVGGRAWDALLGQPFGDQVEALSLNEVLEDPCHVGSCQRVRLQAVEPLSVGGLARVGMGSRIHQAVTVRRATAQKTSFDLRLRFHGGADAHLDAVALPFADPAEHQHDQLVRFVGGVDRPADLGHPQGHSVVVEELKGVAELVTVEGALRLPDHDGVEPAVRVSQLTEQDGRLRPALRRDRSGLVDVEELRDDHTSTRLDQRS
nr:MULTISPECIES: hypothetical protein [unclassified Nonomuraea]